MPPRRDRGDRLDLLARMLRDRPGITASALAADLGVSVRSVFRDIARLRERGFPVDADRGRGGGLRIPASWGLGRVLLTGEEALGTLLALAVAERLGFPMLGAELGRARRRIIDAFPTAERKRIAPLRERVFVGPPASPAVRGSYNHPVGSDIQRLQAAFIGQRVIEAEYEKERGSVASRRLEPHAMVINWPAWYLIAIDQQKGAARTFRLDRFRGVVISTESFRPRPRDVAAELLDDPRVSISAL